MIAELAEVTQSLQKFAEYNRSKHSSNNAVNTVKRKNGSIPLDKSLPSALSGWAFQSDLRLKWAEPKIPLTSSAESSAEVNVRLDCGNLDRLRALGS